MEKFIRENYSAFNIQSLDLGKSSTLQPYQPDGEKFLIFYLDDEIFAIATKNVAEAVVSFPVTILPNSPEWLLGLGNLRGEIVSVINLPKLLQKQTAPHLREQKFIVLHSQVFELAVAFIVDRIGEIFTVAPGTIENNGDEHHPYFLGKTLHKSQSLILIDSETLLSMQIVR